MNYYQTTKNQHFIGRRREFDRLDEITQPERASIIIVYGRRRVGKTELIEQYFINKPILKFEGIQPDKKKKKSLYQEKIYQISRCTQLLAQYTGNPVYKELKLESWAKFFELLTPFVLKEEIILYFEELQWLAHYQDEFLSELKPFWDDKWRHNKRLKLIFSGSSPSFIVSQFMANRAMYGRSTHQLSLKPFSLGEIAEFLKGYGKREIMLANLIVGGIPEYLKLLKSSRSVLDQITRHSFLRDGFLTVEKDRIFVSSLAFNKHYEAIVDFLAKRNFATRDEISLALKGTIRPGGNFTLLLDDLEQCSFITKYRPLLSKESTTQIRYAVSDPYLRFYFKFIKPQLKNIQKDKFEKDPLRALNRDSFRISMGFAFERWCVENEHLLARIMNFDNIEYQAGSYFSKKLDEQIPGFQIDLIYLRQDNRIIIAEIKYGDSFDKRDVIYETEKKINLFKAHNPRYKNYTFEKALITTEEVVKDKRLKEFFDYLIDYNSLF